MAFRDYYSARSTELPRLCNGYRYQPWCSSGNGAGALGVGAIGAIGKKLLAKKAPLKTVAQHVVEKHSLLKLGNRYLIEYPA